MKVTCAGMLSALCGHMSKKCHCVCWCVCVCYENSLLLVNSVIICTYERESILSSQAVQSSIYIYIYYYYYYYFNPLTVRSRVPKSTPKHRELKVLILYKV